MRYIHLQDLGRQLKQDNAYNEEQEMSKNRLMNQFSMPKSFEDYDVISNMEFLLDNTPLAQVRHNQLLATQSRAATIKTPKDTEASSSDPMEVQDIDSLQTKQSGISNVTSSTIRTQVMPSTDGPQEDAIMEDKEEVESLVTKLSEDKPVNSNVTRASQTARDKKALTFLPHAPQMLANAVKIIDSGATIIMKEMGNLPNFDILDLISINNQFRSYCN